MTAMPPASYVRGGRLVYWRYGLALAAAAPTASGERPVPTPQESSMQLKSSPFRGALASLVLATAAAAAQTWPVRPVTAIPAFPPGAPNDFIMRLASEPFTASLKQALLVDNHPGAGGNIAA